MIWEAMGTTVVVEVTDSPSRVEKAQVRLAELEARWTRFTPDSDIGRANRTRGLPIDVHADTRLLVRQALRAHQLTDGAFDPTIHDALVSNGYSRTFDQVAEGSNLAVATSPSPGIEGIVVDDELGTITLPEGVGFDPGGIGKGLAADLLVEELIADGAAGVFVSIGGDIRTGGVPPEGDGWLVPIQEPAVAPRPLATVGISGGAMATSTTEKRTWMAGGTRRHHVIDPRTGHPAHTPVALVTVIAGEGWWAEALATQLFLTDPEAWPRVVGDAAAMVVERDGRRHLLGSMKEFLR